MKILLVTGALLALILVGIVSGSSMNLQLEASGSDGMTGSTQVSYMITSNGTLANPFLVCGQELIEGGSTESYLSLGPSTYQGSLDLNNSDIIHLDTEKEFTGSGVYKNNLFYVGYGAGQPEGGCGPLPVGNTTDNSTIPQEDAYNIMAIFETGMMGSDLKYSSQGGINAWASDAPDELQLDWQMSGNGLGWNTIGSISQTSNGGGPGVLGYENRISSRTNTYGKFYQAGSARYSSFKNTFSEA